MSGAFEQWWSEVAAPSGMGYHLERDAAQMAWNEATNQAAAREYKAINDATQKCTDLRSRLAAAEAAIAGLERLLNDDTISDVTLERDTSTGKPVYIVWVNVVSDDHGGPSKHADTLTAAIAEAVKQMEGKP